jgi:hypothetical protein
MNDADLLRIVSRRLQEAVAELREIAVEQLEQKSMDDLTAGRLATLAYKLEITDEAVRGRLQADGGA